MRGLRRGRQPSAEMKVQIRALYCCVNEGETSWETHIVEGRLGDALSAELERLQPDETVLVLLEQLGELQVFLRAKQYDRAEALAKRLEADLEPVLPDFQPQISLLAESGAKLERGEAEEVLTLLGGVTTALLRAEADTQRGTAQVYLGDAAAEQTFRAATEHDPKHYRALTNLGNVLLEAGRTDEAVELYERAVRLNEGFANAHHNLGVAYRRKGQVSKSVAAIRKAQRVSRQQGRDDARGSVKALAGGLRGRSGKYLRWVLYGGAAAGLYLLFRSQVGG